MSNPSPSFLKIPLVEGRRTLHIRNGEVQPPEPPPVPLCGDVTITCALSASRTPAQEQSQMAQLLSDAKSEREKRLLAVIKVIACLPEASTLSNFDAKQMLDKAIRLALDTLDYEVQRQQAA